MNTPVNLSLAEFVEDYKLFDIEQGMSFDAKIVYILRGVPHCYFSRVAIIPVPTKKMDGIYILNNQVKTDGFADFFAVTETEKIYAEGEGLILHQDDNMKVYIFSTKKQAAKSLTTTTQQVPFYRTAQFLKEGYHFNSARMN